MSTFISNLFGTIANNNTALTSFQPNVSFIPIDGASNTIDIKGNNATWIGLQNKLMQKYAYEFCYPLASIVDKLAEMDTTGKVEIYRKKGKGKEDEATSPWATRMRKLMEQPNPLQSWEQFRAQQIVYKKVYGFCPVLPVVPAGFEFDFSFASTLINLPPWTFNAIPTGKFFGQSSMDGFVKEYTVEILNQKATFQPNQLFILSDGFVQDEDQHFLLPKSKLVGLDMAVSNICAAMEADNVLLRKRGPLGFISHDAAAMKDSIAGYLPMTQKEKDEIQYNLSQYGLNLQQFQYAISRQAIKWNPMSYDVNQLGTKDTVIAGEKAICHRYGFDYVLYEASQSTYANQGGAHKGVYQNNVIPSNEKDMNMYNKFFKSEENNAEIECCFDHLPILQENEMEKATAARAWNEALAMEYEAGLITKNMWLTARGYDTVSDGDTYKTDTNTTLTTDATATPVDVEAQAKANLKGSVGGVQGILAIQLQVSQGVTDYDAGLAILFEIYGFDDATAKRILGDKSILDAKLNENKKRREAEAQAGQGKPVVSAAGRGGNEEETN